MAEYMDTMKEASAKLWMFFKSRQDRVEDSDSFWEDTMRTARGIAREYADTDCGGYASSLAVTYVEELQRLHVRAKGGTTKFRDVLEKLLERDAVRAS